MIRQFLIRSSVIGGALARRHSTLQIVQAKSFSTTDHVKNCANEKKLENLLREADQTESKMKRSLLMGKAVETAEELGMPLGHQGRLYEMSATAHFESEKFDDAEKYFLIAINRWVRSGVEPSSPQIIHISLQLSRVYQIKEEYAKARSGYIWCRDSAKKLLEEDSSLNAKAFYGLTLDALGRFMYDAGHYGESVPLMKESIELAQEIDPTDLNRIGILKINFSSILAETGEVSEALNILNTIITDKNDVLTIQALINQGIIHFTKSQDKTATKKCLQRAFSAAKSLDNPELLLLVKKTASRFNIILS